MFGKMESTDLPSAATALAKKVVQRASERGMKQGLEARDVKLFSHIHIFVSSNQQLSNRLHPLLTLRIDGSLRVLS